MPDVIPGGSPRNPMGVAAMTLSGGEYAIHGTNMPGSVGGFVSYGCIRMLNADISDLYQRVSVGTHGGGDALIGSRIRDLVTRAACGSRFRALSRL